jgi:hypothetical protein
MQRYGMCNNITITKGMFIQLLGSLEQCSPLINDRNLLHLSRDNKKETTNHTDWSRERAHEKKS